MSRKSTAGGSSTQTNIYTPEQKSVIDDLDETYSPYVGKGTLGGMSDLETKALNMLKGADIWGPLSTAGRGLLSGTTGADEINPEQASRAWSEQVGDPSLRLYEDEYRPMIKEAFSGPGYWGSARAGAEREAATDMANSLGTDRSKWMWDAMQSNRVIQEAKAGRSLSAMNAVPQGMLNWTSGLSEMGRYFSSIMNQITDPQVLNILQTILGTSPMGGGTADNKQWQKGSTLDQWGQIAGNISGSAKAISDVYTYGGSTIGDQPASGSSSQATNK